MGNERVSMNERDKTIERESKKKIGKYKSVKDTLLQRSG